VHGITDDMVANEPTFQQIARSMLEFIGDADLAGYNSDAFDVPFLMEEFYRAGFEMDMSNRTTIDVWRLFQKMESHTLKSAHRFYVGSEMEDAHDAMADVRATIAVFNGQLAKYEGKDFIDDKTEEVVPTPIKDDVGSIANFTGIPERVDFAGKLRYNEQGEPVFAFGKHMGIPVAQVAMQDKGYIDWVLKGEFPRDTKEKLRGLIS
jgi:DNA polymerase-3 subunit epsilon